MVPVGAGTVPTGRPEMISDPSVAEQNPLGIANASHDHTGLTPGPISIAGFAPFLGTYFCARPLSTSATYRLPSWSTCIPCTPQNPPGKSPKVPQEYRKLPSRSYLIILFVPRSNSQRWRSAADRWRQCTSDGGSPTFHMLRNLPLVSNT